MNSDLIRVLVVDDDPEDAQLAAIALRSVRRPSYEVRHVNGLAHAFDALESDDFDIVLLDLGLPGTQGLETLRCFRQHNDSVPVVVLSGLEDEDVAVTSLESDAQDYLFKNDVSGCTLSRAIRYAIHRRSSMMEIRRLLTQVRENEEVLRKKNERLAKLYETAHVFVDNISHEFRTPLTVIKEYISLVRDGAMGTVTEEQRRFLSTAEDRADDLNTMVDDMLDVSKLEAGLLGVYRKPQQANQIVGRVAPALSRKARVRNLTLDVEVPDNLPSVYCDGEKIGRVIINLVTNAVKFTRQGGRVHIWARAEGSDVVIGVTDNGPGIVKECLDSIFERFEQVNADVRSSTKGFGLGLNIAKELVELNLGRMHVQSEVGQGSTFSFSVPVADPPEVMDRYLSRLIRTKTDFVTLVSASIANHESEAAADDVDVFVNHVVRGNDLTFRVQQREWVLVLPEPASEATLFLDRANRELELVNRNRPRGPLPRIQFEINASWADLNTTTEEITSRIQFLTRSSEALHA